MIKKSLKKRIRAKKKRIKLVVLLVIFAFLLVLSFRFDTAIVKFFSGLQNPLLNKFMLLVTFLGSSLAVLFVLTLLFLWHERKRKWLLPLWTSLFFSSIFTAIIKLLSARVRPYYLGFPTLQVLINGLDWLGSSFPSSHAAVAFSALPLLDKEFPRLKFFWLIFACLVGFSRIYFSLHYLSDVLFGAVLGYATGFAAVKLELKYKYSSVFRVLGKIIRKGKR